MTHPLGPDHRYARLDQERYLALLARQEWSHQQLLAAMVEQLAGLVRYATRNVPYYREVIGDTEITSLSDLGRLPILTRGAYQSNSSRLVADNVDPTTLPAAPTGGTTTGQPLVVYRDPGHAERERAHIFAAWRRFGVMPGQRVAVVVSRPVGPDGAVYRLLKSTQTLWLGGDYFPPERLTEIAEHIREFRPVLVRGFPSTLSLLAQHIVDEQIEMPDSIVAVGSSSEVLYPWQRDIIIRAFGVPFANLYGQTEQVALAVSCPRSESLHVDTMYGVIEIVDDDGNPITEPGVPGEIVGTGFNNVTAPLIRYATGDIAAWDTPDCACGMRSPRLSVVEGRTAETIVDRSGREHLFGRRFVNALFQHDTPLAQVQFRQDEPGVLNVTVRPKAGVDPRFLEDWVRSALSDIHDFTIVVSAFDEFRLTKSGKHQLLVRRQF